MRHISEKGIELIKKFEGFHALPYICPAGYPTIGYGHLIKKGQNWTHLNEEDAEDLLKQDLLISERSVLRLINVPLTDGQFDSLVSFTFNLGGGNLQASTLRAKVNRGEYEEASEEFPRWCYAKGRKLRGLLIRRIAEKVLFLS